MEDDLSNFHHEDDELDRELTSLVREVEHEEAVRPDLAIPACSRQVWTQAPRRGGCLAMGPVEGMEARSGFQ